MSISISGYVYFPTETELKTHIESQLSKSRFSPFLMASHQHIIDATAQCFANRIIVQETETMTVSDDLERLLDSYEITYEKNQIFGYIRSALLAPKLRSI